MSQTVSFDKSLKKNKEVKLSHFEILFVLLLVFLLGLLTASIIGNNNGSVYVDPLVACTFTINATMGIVCLVAECFKRPFSIMQVHWIFYLVFLVIAPVSQFIFSFNIWDFQLEASDYIDTNILIFVWGVVFSVVSSARKVDYSQQRNENLRLIDAFPMIGDHSVVLMVFMSVVATAIVIANVGFANMFSRSSYSTNLGQTAGLLFNLGIRPLPAFAFLFIYVGTRQRNKVSLPLILAAIMLLVSNFPTGMARYSAATIYGGLLLYMCKPLTERKGFFPLLFLVLLLFVFPALNAYRRADFAWGLMLERMVSTAKSLPSGFCTGDYDAYTMIAMARRYVLVSGCTMGKQLCTAILFFVPRSLWVGKSSGSGSLIASYFGRQFTNVSCPLPAEGLVNFDTVGIVMFAAMFAYISPLLDKWFYEGRGGLRGVYPFLCMLSFLMFRGDLLSSWAYTCGYAFVYVVLYTLCLSVPREDK